MNRQRIYLLTIKAILVTLLISGCSTPTVNPTQISTIASSPDSTLILSTDSPEAKGIDLTSGSKCDSNGVFNLNQPAYQDIQIQAYDGSTYNLNEYRGCVIVLHIWASWCLPCLDQGQILQQILNEYQQRGVYVFGVTYVDTEIKALSAISKMGVLYPNGPDPGMKIATTLGVAGVPETIVYARDGDLAEVIRHPVTYDELSSTLDRLLK